jgi:hypothetical protein
MAKGSDAALSRRESHAPQARSTEEPSRGLPLLQAAQGERCDEAPAIEASESNSRRTNSGATLMLATYKEAEPTPCTFEEAAGAMSAALASVLNASPAVEVLALALAKTTLEAGRQGDKLWAFSKCHCIGNIKAGTKYEGMFTTYTCNEVLEEKSVKRTVWFSPFGRLSGRGGVVVSEASPNPPGHYQTRFRAYANVFDGAYQYVDFIASGRYVDAWQELLEGDAPGYVNALHRKGYFTADPEVYGKGVLSLHREFIAKLSGRPAPNMWIPSVEYVDSIVAKQEWNQKEIRAIATEAAFSSLHDNILAHRGPPPEDLLPPDSEEVTVDETPKGRA